jgi:hypothetical protein
MDADKRLINVAVAGYILLEMAVIFYVIVLTSKAI